MDLDDMIKIGGKRTLGEIMKSRERGPTLLLSGHKHHRLHWPFSKANCYILIYRSNDEEPMGMAQFTARTDRGPAYVYGPYKEFTSWHWESITKVEYESWREMDLFPEFEVRYKPILHWWKKLKEQWSWFKMHWDVQGWTLTCLVVILPVVVLAIIWFFFVLAPVME